MCVCDKCVCVTSVCVCVDGVGAGKASHLPPVTTHNDRALW